MAFAATDEFPHSRSNYTANNSTDRYANPGSNEFTVVYSELLPNRCSELRSHIFSNAHPDELTNVLSYSRALSLASTSELIRGSGGGSLVLFD